MAASGVSWHEVSVSLGWGSLRGKTCVLGDPPEGGYQRVLALHGWLDNANTFDALVPLLPEGLEILALDLAGHGLSDHLPVGGRYDNMTHLIYVREAAKKLGWSDFVFLTHSFGSFIACYYTAMYPREVTALIMLDYLMPYHKEEKLATWRAEASIMQKEERGEGRSRRIYSEEEALTRLVEARKGGNNRDVLNVDRDSARVLLPRAAQPVAGGYLWRHDEKARTRYTMLYGFDNWLYVLSHISCPILVVRAEGGICMQPDQVYAPVLDACRKSSRLFEFRLVPGPHHVHLTHPHRVAPHVAHFLATVVAKGHPRRTSRL